MVEERLDPLVRDKSKGRKSGDCRSIEASRCHWEAIGSISSSEGWFGVGEEIVPESQVGGVGAGRDMMIGKRVVTGRVVVSFPERSADQREGFKGMGKVLLEGSWGT